jgi:hypothetical protein
MFIHREFSFTYRYVANKTAGIICPADRWDSIYAKQTQFSLSPPGTLKTQSETKFSN